METLVILAAAAATLLACFLVMTLSRGTRRAPLRLPREEEWAEDEAAVTRALTPDHGSPIDRRAPILDARAPDAERLDTGGLDRLLEQQTRELKLVEHRDETPRPDERGRAAR